VTPTVTAAPTAHRVDRLIDRIPWLAQALSALWAAVSLVIGLAGLSASSGNFTGLATHPASAIGIQVNGVMSLIHIAIGVLMGVATARRASASVALRFFFATNLIMFLLGIYLIGHPGRNWLGVGTSTNILHLSLMIGAVL